MFKSQADLIWSDPIWFDRWTHNNFWAATSPSTASSRQQQPVYNRASFQWADSAQIQPALRKDLHDGTIWYCTVVYSTVEHCTVSTVWCCISLYGDVRCCTAQYTLSTADIQRSIVNSQQSTVNNQQSIVNNQQPTRFHSDSLWALP